MNVSLWYFLDLNRMGFSHDSEFKEFEEFEWECILPPYEMHMDTLQFKLMKPNCFKAFVDLKDAYYSVRHLLASLPENFGDFVQACQ